MENNKQNTALLIVIAVATLLVAVVGATFAYFTAASNTGSTETVETKSGKMIISYSDGTSDLLSSTDFQPGAEILVNKTFTLTGTNTTSNAGLKMPYSIYLDYVNGFTTEQLHAWVKRTDNESEASATIKGTLVENIPEHADYKNYYEFELETGTKKYAQDNTNSALLLATGDFNANVDNLAITFNLLITFPDTGVPQDTEKGKTFTGKIVIRADKATA